MTASVAVAASASATACESGVGVMSRRFGQGPRTGHFVRAQEAACWGDFF